MIRFRVHYNTLNARRKPTTRYEVTLSCHYIKTKVSDSTKSLYKHEDDKIMLMVMDLRKYKKLSNNLY